MSTLVKFLLAAVLQVAHAGDDPKIVDQSSRIEQSTCEIKLQDLNPHYIITREEFISQLNERAL